MSSIQKIINDLALTAHPEGGYYRRIYENPLTVTAHASIRPINTAIIYLLAGKQFSAFHRIRSDELWFLGEHNTGIRLIELADGDGWQETVLSKHKPFHCVTAGRWFAAQLIDSAGDNYAVSYCTVSPGFDFADFELASCQTLTSQYPQYHQRIQDLCHTSRL